MTAQERPAPGDLLSKRFFHLASELENEAAQIHSEGGSGWISRHEIAARIRHALDTESPWQEAPDLPADPTADDLAIASLADEVARLRVREAQLTALLAVSEAERDDLRQALDERNRQHKALLDEFDLIDGLEGYQHGVAVLEATELADAYTDAGYPVRDDLSHLTGQRQTAAPGIPTTEES